MVAERSQARSGAEGAPRPAFVYSEDHVAAQFEVLNLRVIHNKRRTGFEETKDFPIRLDELVAGRYQVKCCIRV